MPRARSALVVLLGWVATLGAGTRAEDVVRLKPLLSIYADGTGTGLREPEGVDCAAGKLVVADTRQGRVLVYDVTRDAVRARATIAAGEAPLPVRVALLSTGEILVLDGRSRRIVRLTETGESRGPLEPSDAELGSIAPRSLAVGPQDRVHLLDAAGRRILVLDLAGALERTIAWPTEARFLSDLTVDARGDVYAVDSVQRRVYVARRDDAVLAALTPELEADLDFPTSLALDGEGRLFVVDQNGGGVVILGRDGSFRGRQLGMGWREGFVRYPADACVDPAGNLFLAERGNSRVQMFSLR